MTPLRIALFADSAPQFLVRALQAQATSLTDHCEIRPYAFTSPLAVQAELAEFQPDVVLLWRCAEALTDAPTEPLEPILALPYTFIAYTMVSRDDGAYGSCALTQEGSLRKRILRFNLHLAELAEQRHNLHLIDLDWLQCQRGRANTFDPRLWETAALALTPQTYPAMATATLSLIGALRGTLRKVLVTDLDNTFWGGIMGEAGADAVNPHAPGFKTYRQWLRALASRGILLAIASHNDRDPVAAQFAKADLGFTLEDFQACEINWDPKPEMLKRIAAQLHVNLDALVFIDDRLEQREQVRAALPQVCVPEIPDDPACRIPFLAAANLFETPRITADDCQRAQTFKAEALRETAAQSLSRSDYIASLEQVLTAEPLGPDNCERAAQLTQRCNRFNMRGTRHTAAELAQRTGWVYALRDKYGNLGTISVVVLEENVIETWVMSCRVFNRDVETLILNHLKGVAPIRGAYRATDRNSLCEAIYAQHGIPLP